MDRISQYRVARLSIYPPSRDGGNARYCLVAHVIKRGVPSGSVILDGVVPNSPASPTTDELLGLLDSALKQHALVR